MEPRAATFEDIDPVAVRNSEERGPVSVAIGRVRRGRTRNREPGVEERPAGEALDAALADIWRRKLINMKLVEPVEGRRDEHRNTALGNEVSVDLMRVFLGCWATSEVPSVLHHHNFMSEEEMREIWRRIDAGERAARCLRTCSGLFVNISKLPLS